MKKITKTVLILSYFSLKKLAMFALLINVLHSAELPEDHPVKTAVQTTRYMFHQDSGNSGYIK